MSLLSYPDWYDEVLGKLDSAARDSLFPIFDNLYFPAASMRLTAFRDNAEWLIVFEALVFSDPEDSFLSMVYGYGNKMPKSGLINNSVRTLFKRAGDQSLRDGDGKFAIDFYNFEIEVLGKSRYFNLSSSSYSDNNINLVDEGEPAFKLLCMLTKLVGKDFYRSNNELLEACNRINVPIFLQLDEWNHPDLTNGDRPSDNVCLQNFARAISTGQTEIYTCPEEINTSWPSWEYDWY